MKKIAIFSLLACLSALLVADPISPEKALQIAQQFAVSGHVMSMQQSEAGLMHKVPTRNQQSTAPYYIISRGEGQGFVIVSGDDCLPEVLGYCEHGAFDADNLPPALEEMLLNWQYTVESAQADGSNITKAAARKMEAQQSASSDKEDIEPFVTSHWHQSSPYNDNCPTLTSNGNRAATGCVATAAAQILYYWRQDLPSTLQATTPTYSYGDAPVTRSVKAGTPLKWGILKDSYSSEPTEYKQAVAELVFATGAATWLTYGASTSGNLEKVPATFSGYFGMHGGTVKYRDNYSQEGWNNLLYNELKAGRPVMYTGVHPSNGGHAVFVHGYQASSNRVYFNFGWGGGNGYDGWYTTDQSTGMNGFNEYQSCLVGAYPLRSNLEVSIQPTANVVVGASNEFTVTVTNNSTLPYSGVYLFAGNNNPTSLSSAKAKDTETVIPVGESRTIKMSAKPTNTNLWKLCVTDAQLNVVGSLEVTPKEMEANLKLKGLETYASSETETQGAESFAVAYNTATMVAARFENCSTEPFEGNQYMKIYEYNAQNSSWEYVGRKVAILKLKGLSTETLFFTIENGENLPLNVGRYYRAVIDRQPTGQTHPLSFSSGVDSLVHFVLREGGMELVDYSNNVLTLKGKFDPTLFNSYSFAKKTAYKNATAYDLRQCTGVKKIHQEINPNALYYVSEDSEATGVNIVKGEVCSNLQLVQGSNFVPMAPFTAQKASLEMSAPAAKWSLVTCPFDSRLVPGVAYIDITSHANTGIIGRTQLVEKLEAGHTYLVMSAAVNVSAIKGENCSVAASPIENTDASFVGTFVNTTTPDNAMMVNNEETQYFVPVEEGTEVPALGGYFVDPKVSKKFRAFGGTSEDPSYQLLADAICVASAMLEKYPVWHPNEVSEELTAQLEAALTHFSLRDLASGSEAKDLATYLNTLANSYFIGYEGLNYLSVDFTDHIVNPSFEKKTTEGWDFDYNAEAVAMRIEKGNRDNEYRGVGLDGDWLAISNYGDDSLSIEMRQVVEGLKPGFYRLSAMLGSSANRHITLFAGEDSVTVQGDVCGGLFLTRAVIDSICVEAPTGMSTGSLKIGVAAGDWYKADDFRLTFIAGLPVDPAVGIDEVMVEELEQPLVKGIFNLRGQRVDRVAVPGIYIINGKKRIIR